MPKSREIHLVARPNGMPAQGDFALIETQVPDAADGEVLVENLYMSVDPAMRPRLTAGQDLNVAMMGGMRVDRSRVLAVRAKSDATVSRLNEILNEVSGLGVQIKDLDTGLIDFPTFYHGDEVLLCWRLGETGIRFWHGLEEGFRGRKEIDQEFLDNHRNTD